MTIDKFTRIYAKALLKAAVEKKRTLSTERRRYKLTTRKLPQTGPIREVKADYHTYTTLFTEVWAERMRTLSLLDGERSGTKHEIRYLHLARAMMRGLRYRQVEASTREDNAPYDQHLIAALRTIQSNNPLIPKARGWLAGEVEVVKQKAVA